MLALANRHWHYLKSLTGFDEQDSDRLLPLCVHAVQATDAVMVEDTLLHDWFNQHNMVTSAPYIRFFRDTASRHPWRTDRQSMYH